MWKIEMMSGIRHKESDSLTSAYGMGKNITKGRGGKRDVMPGFFHLQ